MAGKPISGFMISFSTEICKFGQQGEKTGWTYIKIPAALAEKLAPGIRKSFRVRGMLDAVAVNKVALLPMGGGDFIMALNQSMRRSLRKKSGDTIKVKLQADPHPPALSTELISCLSMEPSAESFFRTLSPGHQQYFSKWVESAKTSATRAKRIAICLQALERRLDFGAMLRGQKSQGGILPEY